MDEQLANLSAAFDEAGIDVPADPAAMTLGELDNLVEDRRLRGKCKSALVKFQRAAEEQGWQPPSGDDSELEPEVQGAIDTGPLEPVMTAEDQEAAPTAGQPAGVSAKPREPDPRANPVPEVKDWLDTGPLEPVGHASEADTDIAGETLPGETTQAPMSPELREKWDALVEVLHAAEAEVPYDPLHMEVGQLDWLVEGKALRAKCKSALVKFQRAAHDEGWKSHLPPAPATDLPPAEEAPVVAKQEPVEEPGVMPGQDVESSLAETESVVELPPMSAELKARHDAFVAAMGAAGAEVPHDPVHMEVGQLDWLVEDKKLRGSCKSALVKFQRQAKEEGWAPTQPAVPGPGDAPASGGAPAVAAPAPEPAPAAPAAESVKDADEAEEDEALAPAPMSAELQPLYDAVAEAFAAAGAPVPADPVNVDLNSLDEALEDKQLRGKAKSALVKFRRKAADEGWQAMSQPKPKKLAKAAAAPPADAAGPAADTTAESLGVPADPQAPPSELFLLTPSGWEKLGTATREAQLGDEIVGHKTESGATARITSVLVLDGTFDVPEDLYNTYCYLAHEGVVYKAYYISHIGDVKRGTKTASLKVDQTFTYEQFSKTYLALGKHDRPTADDVRRQRFGKRYDTDRRMFVDKDAVRLV